MPLPRLKRPIRLAVRNRELTFTPLGTRFVLVCLAAGVAAVNTGNNLLYLIVAMMLSLMVVSGILSEQTLKGIGVARKLPVEIYAKRPFTVRFTLVNAKKRMPSYAVSVSDNCPGGVSVPAFLPRLGPGGDGSAETVCEVGRRGYWSCKGFNLTTPFPFGFFRKTLKIKNEQSVLVYPQMVAIEEQVLKELSARAGDFPTRKKGHGAGIRSIREYQGFDEARLIHWKSSARLSVLMAKEFEAEEKAAVSVILDDLPPQPPQPCPADYAERFEEAVSLAASVVRHLVLGLDLSVSLVSRGVSTGPGKGRAHYALLMESLALAAPAAAETGYSLIDTALAEGPSVLVLPCGGSPWAGRRTASTAVLEAGR